MRPAGAALPRHMFDDANHAAFCKAIQYRAAKCGNAHRFAAQRAVTDRRMRFGHADIQHRQTIDVNANFVQRQRDGFGIAARSLNRGHGCQVVQRIKRPASRKVGPDGRTHTRDAAAFLINQDRHIIAAMQGPQAVRQRAHLSAVLNIAFKQDVARRFDIAKQAFFIISQGQARKAKYHGLHSAQARAAVPPRQAWSSGALAQSCV